MARYFNTAFSLSMVGAPFTLEGRELTPPQAKVWLEVFDDIQNVANPSHANTLDAVSKKLGIDVRDAKGGRVKLDKGDQALIAQVSFPPTVPRETKEYTDEQIALGTFSFVLVTVS